MKITVELDDGRTRIFENLRDAIVKLWDHYLTGERKTKKAFDDFLEFLRKPK